MCLFLAIYPILLGQNHTSGRTISKGAGHGRAKAKIVSLGALSKSGYSWWVSLGGLRDLYPEIANVSILQGSLRTKPCHDPYLDVSFLRSEWW